MSARRAIFVNGQRGESDTLEKMEGRIARDYCYIREWSLLMDLKILFQTSLVVFARNNADGMDLTRKLRRT
ncbi:MAG: sugar transferase [Planctomycetota bacterium]|nr:sugar transferase [Planctomycetota bacterium]